MSKGKTLFIRNLSEEELQGISILKAEFGYETRAKAVRKALSSVSRLRQDYRDVVAQNVKLRNEIAALRNTLQSIHQLSDYDKDDKKSRLQKGNKRGEGQD